MTTAFGPEEEKKITYRRTVFVNQNILALIPDY